MRFLRGFGVVLIVAISLIGCGDDDGGVGTTGTSTGSQPTSTAPAAATTTVASSPEQARAQAAGLVLADLPGGYAEQPEDDAPDHEETWNDLLVCLGQEPGAGRAGIATSPSFKQSNSTVASTTEYKGSDQAVQALADVFKGGAFAGCAATAFAADFERNVPSGLTSFDVAVAPLDLPGFAGLGESTSAYRASGRVGPGSPIIPVVHDFLVVFDGPAITRLTFITPGEAPAPDFQVGLVKAVADRA